MKLNSPAKVSLLCCLVFPHAGAVLTQAWRHFSPPDKAFTIELPTGPNLVTNKEDSPDILFENTKSSQSYTANLGSRPDSYPEIVFGVLRLSKPMSNRSFDKEVNSNMLVIGGDDKHFFKQADVALSGLHGREFVYEKGDMSGRALFINGRTRIYYLIFQTETEGRISAEVVSRVFNTFRPQK